MLKLHNYQKQSIKHILDNKNSGLFLEMGLGKTITTLTAIDVLIYERFEVERVLIIAPKKVAESTWTDEIKAWPHISHLRTSYILGSERERAAGLQAEADIYLINRENVAWLIAHLGGSFPFDMVVVDELSSFKNGQSQRFKALRRVRPLIKRFVGLTGTPAPNGLIDLWSQMYLVDGGERLFKTVGRYREAFFKPGDRNRNVIFNYQVKDQAAEQAIYDRIKDICISMKTEDYLELPARIDRIKWVKLAPATMEKYKKFQAEMVLQLLDVDTNSITAANAAVLTNKLRQFTAGAVYDEKREWHEIHNEKIEALVEDIEALQGRPAIIFYHYKHDLERIKKRIPTAIQLQGPEDIKDWNAGEIEVLLAHPQSAGHGLNLQFGGENIFWYGLDWGSETYEQGVKRVHRQGVKSAVINTRILARGTIDERIIAALDTKMKAQRAVMESTKAIIKAVTGKEVSIKDYKEA